MDRIHRFYDSCADIPDSHNPGGCEGTQYSNLIANATVSFGRNYLKLRKDMAIAAFAEGMFVFGVNPVVII